MSCACLQISDWTPTVGHRSTAISSSKAPETTKNTAEAIRAKRCGKEAFLPCIWLFNPLVAIFAALGALIRSLLSVARPATSRKDREVSISWNLLRPLVGTLIACVVYVSLRALILPTGKLASVNPYGFIAIAALIGLFCDELLCWFVRRADRKT